MSAETGDVLTAAYRILAAVEAAAAELAVTLPDRRFVSTGGVVFDCPMVNVTVTNIATGIANPSASYGLTDAGPCSPSWNITTEISIVRPANEKMTGARMDKPPTVEMIQSDLEGASADAAVLTRVLEMLMVDDNGISTLGTPSMAIQFLQVEGAMRAVLGAVTSGLWS